MKNIFFCILLSATLFACFDSDKEYTKPVVSSNSIEARWSIINPAIDSVQDGDLILRCGNDHVSFTLKDFSHTEKLYSHSGIALKTDSGIYVYHNMAGDFNPDEIMRSDRIDSFLTPAKNEAFGIYRYDFTELERQSLKEIIFEHYKNKLPFDMNFDLREDKKMYCAEMIAKSVEQATNQRIKFSKSKVTNELKRKYIKLALANKVIYSTKGVDQREFIALDNLYLNPNCKSVFQHIFLNNVGPVKFPEPEKTIN
ncbi:MAG: hypothetical protein EPO57_01160 [Chitinophagaceae bacterium]|nr:MAG: hypothetical protein EPO57_01160 [Chitinophagaceae bacterium]